MIRQFKNSPLGMRISDIKSAMKITKILRKEGRVSKKLKADPATKVLLLAHALEKGMCMREVKMGFGLEKARSLVDLLMQMKRTSDTERYAYAEGVAVLQAYVDFQSALKIDVSSIEKFLDELRAPISRMPAAGVKVLKREQLKPSVGCDFESFVKSRHSIRHFDAQKIEKAQIEKAIQIAGCCPSACNRQPNKVYFSMDDAVNRALGDLVPGNKGFSEDIPYYCVVATDRQYFKGEELFQWFINGGIFLGNFILALHSLGIGSCIFQWPAFSSRESELKRILRISESEAIIAVVGYGMYPEQEKCLCAERKSLKEISVPIEGNPKTDC